MDIITSETFLTDEGRQGRTEIQRETGVEGSLLGPEASPEEQGGTGARVNAEEEMEVIGARRNGKVARLPKTLRDRINKMIDDGIPYAQIIEQLGEDGSGLSISNISRWKEGGYKDWLQEQTWLWEARGRRESASELSSEYDATQLNHAALQLGTLQMFEALRDLSLSPQSKRAQDNAETATKDKEPASPSADGESAGNSGSEESSDRVRQQRPRSKLDSRLGGDSASFFRLIHALARASRETLEVQKYREACAKARAVLTELKDPNRKLTESETRAIVMKVDDILGLTAAREARKAQQQ